MGKAKKRIIAKGKNQQLPNITRDEAIQSVVSGLAINDVQTNLITLFGLSAEELLEAGAKYEEVKAIRGLFND